MGKNPVVQVKVLLWKLDSMKRNQERGNDVSEEIKCLSNKFVGQVKKIFKNLPKLMEWLSFLNHDLPLLLSTCKEVQDASIRHNRNNSPIKALAKLKKASEIEFQRIANPKPTFPNVEPQ